MKRNFFLCGLAGWCLEIFWTGMHDLFQGHSTMMGNTSLLMFPIYGCAAFFYPMCKKLCALPALLRGTLYTCCIYLTEFVSGSILKVFHMCPWDYSQTPLHYKGIIRLDYAPVWFLTGLLFEKILTKSS